MRAHADIVCHARRCLGCTCAVYDNIWAPSLENVALPTQEKVIMAGTAGKRFFSFLFCSSNSSYVHHCVGGQGNSPTVQVNSL